ncbi:MAG: hypothetical protein HY664_05775 [Chloroflexi bacterium]|nr:hypothetical protein [Chloroflexota bacterium]
MEECLATSPETAAELEPLLMVAVAAAEATALVPRPEFEAAARHRFYSALQSPKAKSQRAFWRSPRWAMTLVVLILFFFLGGGVVSASDSALPGERLYPMKRAVEEFRLTTAWGSGAKIRLRLAYAQRRVHEAQALTARERHISPSFWEDMANETNYITYWMGPEPHKQALTEKIILLTENQQGVLEQILEMAPPPARPALQRALEASRRGHERALQSLEKERPTQEPSPSGKENFSPVPRNQRPLPFGGGQSRGWSSITY